MHIVCAQYTGKTAGVCAVMEFLRSRMEKCVTMGIMQTEMGAQRIVRSQTAGPDVATISSKRISENNVTLQTLLHAILTANSLSNHLTAEMASLSPLWVSNASRLPRLPAMQTARR